MDGRINLKCVIYDCDGVMFDSLDANRRLYNHIAKNMGREELSEEELRFCHTHTVHESIEYIFRDQPEKAFEAKKFLKEKVNLMDFIPYLKMEPNLVEALKILKDSSIKLAVCTNRTTTMRPIIEMYGLGDYFDIVVTALDVANPKPHPEAVLKILDALKVPKNETIFVGDSEIDRITAIESGVHFVSYKNPKLEALCMIDNHLQLIDLFLPRRAPQ